MFAQLVTKLIENVDLYTRRVISFRLTLEHSSPLLLLPHRYPIDTPSYHNQMNVAHKWRKPQRLDAKANCLWIN